MGLFSREEDGVIYIIDEESGACIAKSAKPDEFIVVQGKDYLLKQYMDGREYLVTKFEKELEHLQKNQYPFSKILCDIICQKVAEGGKLTEVCGRPPIPPYDVIRRWMVHNEDFRHNLALAKEARSEYMHDRALITAENSEKETAQSDRLRIETYKWSAAKSNPDEYGDRTKIVGDKNAPIAWIIDTGVKKDDPVERDVTNQGELDGSTEAAVCDVKSAADLGSGGDAAENNDRRLMGSVSDSGVSSGEHGSDVYSGHGGESHNDESTHAEGAD